MKKNVLFLLLVQPAGLVSISDSKGTEYLKMKVTDHQEFLVGMQLVY